MSSVFWIALRITAIGLFAFEGARVTNALPSYHWDPSLWVFLPLAFIFAVWRFSSILRRRFEEKKRKDDWTASLWTSPIFKNPESFFVIAALAFIAAATVSFVTSPPGCDLEPFLMELTFGAGVLCGWVLFRTKTKRRANQPLDTNALSRQ